ncbi:hypothetical protein FF1_001636 [Malus domestica]
MGSASASRVLVALWLSGTTRSTRGPAVRVDANAFGQTPELPAVQIPQNSEERIQSYSLVSSFNSNRGAATDDDAAAAAADVLHREHFLEKLTPRRQNAVVNRNFPVGVDDDLDIGEIVKVCEVDNRF